MRKLLGSVAKELKEDEQIQLLKELIHLAMDIRMILVFETLRGGHCVGSYTGDEQLNRIRERLSQDYVKPCRTERVPCETDTTSNQTD